MTLHRFVRYELLTTEVPAAQAFYTQLLGPDFWGEDVRLSTLPEQARARGARPHFRGHLAVDDVELALTAWCARGATPLGPLVRDAAGVVRSGLREPAGAVLSLSSEPAPPSRGLVVWHALHATNETQAFAPYRELLGWVPLARRDLGAEQGVHQLFAWDDDGPARGSVSNLALRPEVHRQWLFFFAVSDLERSLAAVREAGGLTLPPVHFEDGRLAAGCDDPQGAAFGLLQTP